MYLVDLVIGTVNFIIIIITAIYIPKNQNHKNNFIILVMLNVGTLCYSLSD